MRQMAVTCGSQMCESQVRGLSCGVLERKEVRAAQGEDGGCWGFISLKVTAPVADKGMHASARVSLHDLETLCRKPVERKTDT